MKATLEFNLPEENEEFETASNAWKYKSVLWEMDNYLRNKLKYEELKGEEYVAYEQVREHLWSLINEENVTLY